MTPLAVSRQSYGSGRVWLGSFHPAGEHRWWVVLRVILGMVVLGGARAQTLGNRGVGVG